MDLGGSEPLVEEFYLGEPNLEAFYTTEPLSAMAIQPELSNATKRARYVEAWGYHRKPPKSGERQCYVAGSFDQLDEISISATLRGIEECVTESEIQDIKEAYAEDEFGDAWWISWRCEQHVHLVIAVLRYLESKNSLPPKFS